MFDNRNTHEACGYPACRSCAVAESGPSSFGFAASEEFLWSAWFRVHQMEICNKIFRSL